jgi:hypothetical protein
MPSGYVGPIPPAWPLPESWPRLGLHIRVRWNALALDSALADGARPGVSDELTLRAEQLADEKSREKAAKAIGRVLELAERGSAAQLATTRVPFRKDRVEASRPQLMELAATLRSNGPHPVQGLAMANLLVEDGDSSLYVHDRPDHLEQTVEATLAAFHR